MSVDIKHVKVFGGKLGNLVDDMPAVISKLIVGEGVYAVRQAKLICKEDGVVNNGTYRMNFHAGSKGMQDPGPVEHDGSPARRAGQKYRIDVYNNLHYAKHLEYGFRSHFVPGFWEGHTFVYQPGFPGGMYVGPYNGFVQGHFTLRQAIRYTKQTQNARLQRKFERVLQQRLNGKGGENETK